MSNRIELKEPDLGAALAQMGVNVSRETMRQYVALRMMVVEKMLKRGESVYEFNLDELDAIDFKIKDWTLDAQINFKELYAQELDAYSANVAKDVEKLGQDVWVICLMLGLTAMMLVFGLR